MTKYADKRRIFWDIETTPIKSGPVRFVCAVTKEAGQLPRRWTNEEKLFRWMLAQPDVVFIAHNSGKFDSLWYQECILKYETRPHYKVIMSGSALIILSNEKTGAMLVDSYRLIPAGLARLEKDLLGTETKQFDFNENWNYLDMVGMIEDLLCYCENDVIILEKVFDLFAQIIFDLFGVSPGITIASTAHKCWRAICDIPVFESFHSEKLRTYYYGGRVEIFAGTEQVELPCVFDVNSMYPAMMYATTQPVGRPTEFSRGTIANNIQQGDFYDVTVKIPPCHVAPLPYLSRGKLYFPTGEFRGVYSGFELADREHLIQRVHGRLRYRQERLFADYVSTLYERRKEAVAVGQGAVSFVCKILLNSLYGKFAQKPEHETIEIRGHGSADDGTYTRKWGKLWVHHGVEAMPFRDGNVAISASITAAARRVLSEQLEAIDPGSLYYCDTDSLHCHLAEAHKMPEPTGEKVLGEWAHEFSGDTGEYLAPKIYKLEKEGEKPKKAHKGFSEYPARGVPSEKTVVGTAKRIFSKGEGFGGYQLQRTLHNPSPKRDYSGTISRPWNIDELP